MSELRRYLEELVKVYGIPGFEDDVREVMKRELAPLVDEVTVDGMGNVIGRKDGEPGGPKLLFSAHMDEVGLLVGFIDKDGFIKLTTGVGYIDPRILLALDVLVHTENGTIPGVIGTKAVHLLSPKEMEKPVEMKDMFVDIAAHSREQAEEWGVRIGCPVTFDATFREMRDPDIVLGRALDDRVGCAVMLEVMRRLAGEKLEATIFAVGSVQEEVGLRGAGAAAFGTDPDVAVVLDLPFPGGDTPGIEEGTVPLRMGGGVFLEVEDFVGPSPFHGVIINPHLRRFIEGLAREAGIPVQLACFSGMGTTDGATIQWSRSGVPVAVIAASGRYDHGPLVMASMKDLEMVTELTVLTARNIQKFKRPS